MAHSPDGKAYLIGHGGAPSPNIHAWMLGDNIHMARVDPTVESIADKSKWEFYAGGTGASAKWVSGDVSQAVPILDWIHHTGTSHVRSFGMLVPPPALVAVLLLSIDRRIDACG
jgi:hypothetical protein